jgi:hypothetical protein
MNIGGGESTAYVHFSEKPSTGRCTDVKKETGKRNLANEP